MVVPKTTETRCRDGSMQARHVIQACTSLDSSSEVCHLTDLFARHKIQQRVSTVS